MVLCRLFWLRALPRVAIGRFLGRKPRFPEWRAPGAFRLKGGAFQIRRPGRPAPSQTGGTRLQCAKQALQLQHRSPQPQENEASDDRSRAGRDQRVACAELIDRDAESDHGDADQYRQDAERQWNQVHADRGPPAEGLAGTLSR